MPSSDIPLTPTPCTAAALKALLEEMPILANDGSTFRIQHRSSAMSAAPLSAPDGTFAAGPGPLLTDLEAPQSAPGEAVEKLRSTEQDTPQSSMPVLEASHRGSLILSVFLEPRTGRFRFRMSEEVLQYSDADYAAVIRAVRRYTPSWTFDLHPRPPRVPISSKPARPMLPGCWILWRSTWCRPMDRCCCSSNALLMPGCSVRRVIAVHRRRRRRWLPRPSP